MKRSFTLQLAAISYCCIKTHIVYYTDWFYRKNDLNCITVNLFWYNEKKKTTYQELMSIFVITINTSQSSFGSI